MKTKLSKAETERLVLLAEECGEVIQAVSKILRHGFEACHPRDLNHTNRAQLTNEIGDLLACIELHVHAGDVSNVYVAQTRKLLRVGKYLHARENRTHVESIIGKVPKG